MTNKSKLIKKQKEHFGILDGVTKSVGGVTGGVLGGTTGLLGGITNTFSGLLGSMMTFSPLGMASSVLNIGDYISYIIIIAIIIAVIYIALKFIPSEGSNYSNQQYSQMPSQYSQMPSQYSQLQYNGPQY